MSRLALRVIKFGGSLLEAPDWERRFADWFACLPPARTLLLVGGGPPVDALRHLASLSTYDDVFMHWLCIDAMDLSYRVVKHRLVSQWQGLEDADQLQRWQTSSECDQAVVHVRSFYTTSNYRTLPVHLPLSWDTTSDSLSALLAKIVGAAELILIKSRFVSAPYDWSELAQAGIVDQAFPMAVAGLSQVSVIALPD